MCVFSNNAYYLSAKCAVVKLDGLICVLHVYVLLGK